MVRALALQGSDDFANIIVFLGTKGEHTVSVLLRDELFLNLYRLGRTLLYFIIWISKAMVPWVHITFAK